MDALFHNPVAEMYGPHFLLLYALVIGGTLAACASAVKGSDPTKQMPAPLVPPQPDPCELAYLRGGANEVVRLVILTLLQRGYLEKQQEAKKWWGSQPPAKIGASAKRVEPGVLAATETAMLRTFAKPKTASEMFQAGGLTSMVSVDCLAYEQHLNAEQLLAPPALRSAALQTRAIGAACIIGLGLYKLVAASYHGHSNVGFLILEGIVGTILLFRATRAPRLSSRGRLYLEQLRLAFGRLKSSVAAVGVGDEKATANLALLVALFGMGALSNTAYAYFPQIFQQAAGNSGGCGSAGGCGSSGGSCGGGGGCGGGCGGGGCGGCGGG